MKNQSINEKKEQKERKKIELMEGSQGYIDFYFLQFSIRTKKHIFKFIYITYIYYIYF